MMERSPALRPRPFRTFANRQTRRVQFLVGDGPLVARLAFEDNGGFAGARPFYVAIQTVIGDVRLGARKPFRERGIGPIENVISISETNLVPVLQAHPRSLQDLSGRAHKGLDTLPYPVLGPYERTPGSVHTWRFDSSGEL